MSNTLNAEGWHPATRLQTFDAEMVNRLLTPPKPDRGTHSPSPPPTPEKLEANEWTASALAHHLGRSRSTVYGWATRGWVQARKAKTEHPYGGWILRADEAELARLAALRPVPHRPRRPPA